MQEPERSTLSPPQESSRWGLVVVVLVLLVGAGGAWWWWQHAQAPVAPRLAAGGQHLTGRSSAPRAASV